MNAEMLIGLRIGVIGLGVTFLALGILSLVMKYLPRLFPAEKAKPAAPPTAEDVSTDQQLEEMAVALAVGICMLEERNALTSQGSTLQDPNLGKLLEIQ